LAQSLVYWCSLGSIFSSSPGFIGVRLAQSLVHPRVLLVFAWLKSLVHWCSLGSIFSSSPGFIGVRLAQSLVHPRVLLVFAWLNL
jgi:heme-degrading monooxygenase HmoA